MPSPSLTTSPLIRSRLIRSPLLDSLGVPHGFTTRIGGVSGGAYDSLNFGSPWDIPSERRDSALNIAKNLELAMGEAGLGGRELLQVHQVHGAAVVVSRRGEAAPCQDPADKADAIVTDDAGRCVGVRVADCAPVLLASEDGAAVASVHAGWRGVVEGVLARAVEALRAVAPGRAVLAAVGPCISGARFEVGPEVAEAFAAAFGAENAVRAGIVLPPGDGRCKHHVDIGAALEVQAKRLGVAAVERAPLCTFERADLFFSHRRDKGMTGRMIALIGPRGA